MSLFNRLFLGRKIDDWASRNALIAATALNQVAADLIVNAEAEISSASLKDGLFLPKQFLQHRIAPMVRSISEPIATELLTNANIELLEIVEEQADWARQPGYIENPEGIFEGTSDIAVAVAPMAVGVTAAAALPFTAVTTTTAWFGLVSATAISWPVVIGGGALAGLSIATGVFNTAKLRDKTFDRLRQKTRQFVISSLIEGSEASPAILQQLVAAFDEAAHRAKAF